MVVECVLDVALIGTCRESRTFNQGERWSSPNPPINLYLFSHPPRGRRPSTEAQSNGGRTGPTPQSPGRSRDQEACRSRAERQKF